MRCSLGEAVQGALRKLGSTVEEGLKLVGQERAPLACSTNLRYFPLTLIRSNAVRLKLRSHAVLLLEPIATVIFIPPLASLMDFFLPSVPLGGGWWVASPVFILGLLLGVSSARLIYNRHQWPERKPVAVDPPEKFVDIGPYRYLRNPMLLGIVLMVLGEGLFFRSPGILVYTLILFIVLHCYVVLHEEKVLAASFGDRYRRYTEMTPRWVPRLRGHASRDRDARPLRGEARKASGE